MKSLEPVSYQCVLILALLTVVGGASSARAQTAFEQRPGGVAVGAGRWESSRAAGDNRDWQIEVERFDDDSIAGSIIVIGSPSLHKTRVEGRVDGSEVYGVLVADGGKQVGTFTGTIGEAGLSGTYTTTEGDSASWTWAGPAAARSLKAEKTESAAAE